MKVSSLFGRRLSKITNEGRQSCGREGKHLVNLFKIGEKYGRKNRQDTGSFA